MKSSLMIMSSPYSALSTFNISFVACSVGCPVLSISSGFCLMCTTVTWPACNVSSPRSRCSAMRAWSVGCVFWGHQSDWWLWIACLDGISAHQLLLRHSCRVQRLCPPGGRVSRWRIPLLPVTRAMSFLSASIVSSRRTVVRCPRLPPDIHSTSARRPTGSANLREESETTFRSIWTLLLTSLAA